MSKTKPTTNILQLPREVFHHHIFRYLDFIKDICRDPYLSYIPVQKHEIDFLLRTPYCVDFEKELHDLSELGPLSLTCSIFAKMIASYTPLTIQFRYACIDVASANYPSVKRGFECETTYAYQLWTKKWYDFSVFQNNKQKFRILDHSRWIGYLERFIKRRKACFHNVEHVGVFSETGKNCVLSPDVPPIRFPFYLFPKLKYLTLHMLGVNINVLETLPENVTANFVERAGLSSWSLPLNIVRDVWRSGYAKKIDAIVQTICSVVKKFPKQYLRVEPYILILLKAFKFNEARYLIDHFTIDEDYFSYAWSIASDESFEFNSINNEFCDTIAVLAHIKHKYKGIVIKRLSINSVEQLKIVEQYGILDPKDIMPNLSIQFLNSMSDNQNLELLKLLIDQYGVYIGHYGCSLLYVLSDFMIDFVKTHIQGYDFTKNQNISGSYQLENSSLNKGFNDHSEETEKFGIPFPLQFISLKSSIQTIFNNLQVDPYLKDMYGNNILHYCYFFRIALLTTEKSALNLEEEAISKLLHEPNHFGVTPFMIDVLQHSFRHEEISFTLTYHPNYHCASLKNRMKECHGLKWTPSRILLKFTNATAQSQHYPNIDARDENGKHWCHYKTRLFSVRNDLRECVTCNDKDNVILLHTLTNSLLEIHRELLTNQILPSFDYLAYFDHFGWNRLMHIFAFITNFVSYPQFEVLKEDLFPIGFEYINKQQTQDQPNPKQLVLVSV